MGGCRIVRVATTMAVVLVVLAASASAHVTPSGVTFSAVVGQQFTGIVATFVGDPNGPDASFYAASVDWGDGSNSSPGVIGGTSPNFSVRGTQTYHKAGTFQVTVTITHLADQHQDVAHSQAVVTAPAPTTADLVVSKTASPDPVEVGHELTYSISIRNVGAAAATNARVRDVLPTGASFVSASSSCSGTATVVCDVGTLAPGAGASATIVVTPRQAGKLTNTATVTSSTQDANEADNTSTATTTVTPSSNRPPIAVVSVSGTQKVGKPIVFDASRSKDPDGSIVGVDWDLTGNGTFETSCGTGKTGSVSYGVPGRRVVTLRVTDTGGTSSVAKAAVNVKPSSGGASKTGVSPTLTSCVASIETNPCFKSVTFGIAEARASCFRKEERELDNPGAGPGELAILKVTEYTTPGFVRLNGLDVKPVAGSEIRIRREGRKFMGNVKISLNSPLIGSVPVANGPIDWKLPSAGGTYNLASFPIGKYASLLGLSLEGDAQVQLVDGACTIPVWVALPDPFNVSGRMTLKADNDRGLRLNDARIDLKQVFIGSLELRDVYFLYDEPSSTFAGGGTLRFPGTGELTIDVAIKEGSLDYLRAAYSAPPPGLALGGSVYFQNASFSYRKGPPLDLYGTVGLTAGPALAGKELARINGKMRYLAASPSELNVTGDLSLAGIPTADAYFNYKSSGYIAFGGHAKGSLLGVVTADGSISAWYQDSKHFNAEGSVTVCVWKGCGGGALVVSSTGLAGCEYTWLANFGVGYTWGGKIDFYLKGCSIAPYRGVPLALHGVRPDPSALAAIRDVELPAGLPFEVFRVEGRNAVPQVTVTGPGGRRIVGTADPDAYISNRDSGFIVWNIGPEKASYVIVARPAAGRWNVTAEGATSVNVANGLPKPSVHARVTGSGRARTLVYSVAAIPGQRVQFSEEGRSTARVIGFAARAKGSFRFAPGDGVAGVRKIFALVEQNGVPRAKILVASYRAPGPLLPARPGRLRAVRRGSILVVSWAPAARATRYVAKIRVSDRRLLALVSTGSRRSVTIPQFGARDGATISVAGLLPDNRPGPSTTLVVRRVH